MQWQVDLLLVLRICVAGKRHPWLLLWILVGFLVGFPSAGRLCGGFGWVLAVEPWNCCTVTAAGPVVQAPGFPSLSSEFKLMFKQLHLTIGFLIFFLWSNKRALTCIAGEWFGGVIVLPPVGLRQSRENRSAKPWSVWMESPTSSRAASSLQKRKDLLDWKHWWMWL